MVMYDCAMTPEEKRVARAAYMREWRKNNIERVSAMEARSYDRTQKASQERRNAKLAALKAKPCMDCGVRYPPYVMDFDHRNPDEKLFSLNSMAMTRSAEKLAAEIAKCDLVCANCHRERTHQQRLDGRRFGGYAKRRPREFEVA